MRFLIQKLGVIVLSGLLAVPAPASSLPSLRSEIPSARVDQTIQALSLPALADHLNKAHILMSRLRPVEVEPETLEALYAKDSPWSPGFDVIGYFVPEPLLADTENQFSFFSLRAWLQTEDISEAAFVQALIVIEKARRQVPFHERLDHTQIPDFMTEKFCIHINPETWRLEVLADEFQFLDALRSPDRDDILKGFVWHEFGHLAEWKGRPIPGTPRASKDAALLQRVPEIFLEAGREEMKADVYVRQKLGDHGYQNYLLWTLKREAFSVIEYGQFRSHGQLQMINLVTYFLVLTESLGDSTQREATRSRLVRYVHLLTIAQNMPETSWRSLHTYYTDFLRARLAEKSSEATLTLNSSRMARAIHKAGGWGASLRYAFTGKGVDDLASLERYGLSDLEWGRIPTRIAWWYETFAHYSKTFYTDHGFGEGVLRRRGIRWIYAASLATGVLTTTLQVKFDGQAPLPAILSGIVITGLMLLPAEFWHAHLEPLRRAVVWGGTIATLIFTISGTSAIHVLLPLVTGLIAGDIAHWTHNWRISEAPLTLDSPPSMFSASQHKRLRAGIQNLITPGYWQQNPGLLNKNGIGRKEFMEYLDGKPVTNDVLLKIFRAFQSQTETVQALRLEFISEVRTRVLKYFETHTGQFRFIKKAIDGKALSAFLDRKINDLESKKDLDGLMAFAEKMRSQTESEPLVEAGDVDAPPAKEEPRLADGDSLNILSKDEHAIIRPTIVRILDHSEKYKELLNRKGSFVQGTGVSVSQLTAYLAQNSPILLPNLIALIEKIRPFAPWFQMLRDEIFNRIRERILEFDTWTGVDSKRLNFIEPDSIRDFLEGRSNAIRVSKDFDLLIHVKRHLGDRWLKDVPSQRAAA
jgi:hypothetical protein